MREHGFSYGQAAALVPRSPDDDDDEDKAVEFVRLLDVLLSRRRTMSRKGGGEDWSETWLGKDYAQLARDYGLEAIGNLTLDQFGWLCSSGEADDGGQYDLEAIVAEHAAMIPRIKAAMEAGTIEEVKPVG